jgi:GAF domain-containing protein
MKRTKGSQAPKVARRKVAAKRVRPARASPTKAKIPASSDLQGELAQARERLAATTDILGAIAASPGDADGSLRKIAQTAARLFGALGVSFHIAESGEFKLSVSVGKGAEQIRSNLFADPAVRRTVGGRNLPGTVVSENRQIQRKGECFYRSVSYGFPADFADYVKDRPVELRRDTATGRALMEGEVIHIPDAQADLEYTWKEAQRLGGFRTLLGVPMLRDGAAVGVLTLTRTKPFTDKQIELVSTFADQAAIAIESVRLFESVEARTRELAASLQDLRTAQDRLVQT